MTARALRARRSDGLARLSARRIVWSAVTVTALAVYLCARLFVVQAIHGPAYARQAFADRRAIVPSLARRGTIYDRSGAALARWAPAVRIDALPDPNRDPQAAARKLVPYLDFSQRSIAAVLAAGRRLPLAYAAPVDVGKRIAALGIPGIAVEPVASGRRDVGSGTLAPSVLGYTNVDDRGIDGVEASFDSILNATPSTYVVYTDPAGYPLPFAERHYLVRGTGGDGVELTIDSFLQFTAQRVLDDTIRKWSARSGTAIVMDPQTGGILALANSPSFDVRRFSKVPARDLRDRAISDSYEPGSTFKLVLATAALESGLVTPRTLFRKADRMMIGGYVIHNAEDGFLAGGNGMETLGQIIMYSHNVGAAEVGLRIGRARLYRAIRAFGFGKPTGVELGGESGGIVPAFDDWSDTTLPTVAFGQGIAVTPLSLVRAYAAIANGGLLLRPRVVHEILAPDGTLVYRYRAEVVRRVMPERIAAILRGYLRGVVTTGTGNPGAKVAGYTTAGKTGTAQVVENGRYARGAYVASFVGMIPAERPRFVILVKIDEPSGSIYGGTVAAPAFAEIARAAMLHAGILPRPAEVAARRPRSAKHTP